MTCERHHRPLVVAPWLLAWLLLPGHAEAQEAPRQEAKAEFVAHLLRFAEAASGVYGDEGAQLEAHLEGMRQALGRWDREIATAEASLAGLPRNAAAARAAIARLLAIQLLDRGRLEDAERELARALELDDRHADVWQLLGAMRSRLGRPEAAADPLDEAARLEPEAPVTWYMLAEEARRAGDRNQATRAREAFRRTARAQLARQASAGPGTAATPFPDWGLLQEPAGARPYFLPAIYTEGLTWLRDGRHAEALASLSSAVAADPLVALDDAARARLAEAGAALRRSDLPAALGLLQALVAEQPGNAEAHRIHGNALRAAGRHAESFAALEIAVDLQPANERARAALADVLVAAGRTAEAGQTLRDTVRLRPDSGLANLRLGEVSTTLRQYEIARQALGDAIAIRPLVGIDALYRALADLPREQEADDEAAVERQRGRVALDLNDAGARVALGTALLELGDNEGAAVELLAALLVDPGHVEANAALAQANLRLDDHAGVVAPARRALAGDPGHAAAQYALATALVRLGEAEEATAAFERYRQMLAETQASRRRDFDLGMLLEQAREHASRGAIDEAVASLRAGMNLRPDDPALHLSAGLLLLNGQRPQEAIAELEEALALGAEPAVHQHLAAAYDALGRPDDARRHQALFERSLVAAPRRP